VKSNHLKDQVEYGKMILKLV